MNILDTNIILRFLLRDVAEQADFAIEIMAGDSFIVPTEVTAEVVYVLSKVYQVERYVIVEMVHKVIHLANAVVPQKSVIDEALVLYGQSKIDFVDCLLFGYAKCERYNVITFDKNLNKKLKSLI